MKRYLSMIAVASVLASSAAMAQSSAFVLPTNNTLTLIPLDPSVLDILRRPDLSVMSITPRMLGAHPYAYVCVRNNGIAATGAFNVALMMGAPAPTGSPPISWITLVGTHRFSSAPAAPGFTCADIALPGAALPNCVKYTARVDADKEITESSESNNVFEQLSACVQ